MKKWPGNAHKEITTFGGLSRSALMSRIHSNGNLSTEIKMMSLLKKESLKGWRRKYKMIGKPDFVWPKEKLILFIDGCFWHGHNCGRSLLPKINAEKWQEKIANNKKRDKRLTKLLKSKGWIVIRFWECHLNKKPDSCIKKLKKILL